MSDRSKLSLRDRAARDAEICRRYVGGMTLAEAGRPYGITRMRVKQIIKTAGLWRPRVSQNSRGEYLGVNLSEADKEELRREAERRGVSMSLLTSDLIREMLAAKPGDGESR